jgi:hypothetical protein
MRKFMTFLAGALALAVTLALVPASAATAATPTTTVSVKASSSTVTRGSSATLKVAVTTGTRAGNGYVYVYDGKTKVKSLALQSGKATYTLSKTIKRGVHKFTVVHVNSKASKSVYVTVKSKATWTVTPSTTTYTREVSTPTIAVAARVDGAALNGTVYLRESGRTIAKATTSNGKATVRVPASLAKGTHYLTVSFSTWTGYVIVPSSKTIKFVTKSLAVMAGEGTYVVGSQVQPGLYVSKGNTGGCYWARLSDATGDFDAILANDIGDGPRYMRIKDTDALVESSDCNDWYAAPSTGTPVSFVSGDGWYRVGVDLNPGLYQTVTPVDGDSCYWARLSDATGDFDDIIANDFGEGTRTVQVLDSDAFLEVSGCGKLTKID